MTRTEAIRAVLLVLALLVMALWAATMPSATPEQPTKREMRGGR